MKAAVDERLGDVHGRDPMGALARVGEDDFVQWLGRVGQVKVAPQLFAQIVGVEHGASRDLAQAIRAQFGEVGVGAHADGEVAEEGAQAADALGRVEVEAIADGGIGFQVGRERFDGGLVARPRVDLVALACVLKAAFAHHARHRQKVAEGACHADGACAWATATMWRGKGFVQVDVHDIDAEVGGAHAAEEGVEIGAVAIEKGAFGVDKVGDVADAALEEAEGVGVGHHQGGHIAAMRVEGLGHGVGGEQAVGVTLELDDLKASHGAGGRVRAVGAVRDEDFAPFFAAGLDGGADHEHAGKFAMSACRGNE